MNLAIDGTRMVSVNDRRDDVRLQNVSSRGADRLGTGAAFCDSGQLEDPVNHWVNTDIDLTTDSWVVVRSIWVSRKIPGPM